MNHPIYVFVAWGVLVLGVALEARIMETEQRQVCEGCETPAILWSTPAGWMCENCDLEELEKRQTT